jgi:hypothetical protein
VLWASYHGFRHILVMKSNYPCTTLLGFDYPSCALESAVRHTLLLGAIKHNCDSITDLVLVHDSSDIYSTSLSFRPA